MRVMAFKDLPIKSKVIAVILVTSITVLVLTTAAFIAYDSISNRRTIVGNVSTMAAMIAETSTAALGFKDEETAQQILAGLKADPHIVMAALYDERGDLFVRYPLYLPESAFPRKAQAAGSGFVGGYLFFFQPVKEGGRQY